MNKGIRFMNEFEQDPVAQVVGRGYSVGEVAERSGIRLREVRQCSIDRNSVTVAPTTAKKS